MKNSAMTIPHLDFTGAAERLKGVITHTPLVREDYLSNKYSCNVFLKREDLQPVRSYKLRGAYNMISSLSHEQVSKGIVCSSAGNHAQGVAYSCTQLNINGVIFMPTCTPAQKIRRVRMFSTGFVEINLFGDAFDDCNACAVQFAYERDMQ